MITVAHGSPQTIWLPVQTTIDVYVGSIICMDTSAFATREGVIVREQADGVENLTNSDVPLGVVVGTNEKIPLFSTTYKCEYTTGAAVADAHDGSAREYILQEGPWSKGDQRSMVEVAVIGPATVLRAPIYHNAVGTAPTLLTCTATDTDGKQATTNNCGFTPVAGMATIYCRKGSNAGIYRITDDTSGTTAEWDVYMPKDVAIGDTFVRVPVVVGPSHVRLGDDTVCSYVNSTETPGTHYETVIVTRLDLREAGKEFCEFMFAPSAFIPYNIFATTA